MKSAAVAMQLAVICALLAAATAAAQAVEEEPVKFEQVMTAEGDALYAELCAVCHGATGKGGGPGAVALAIEVPDLTALAAGNGGVYPAERVEKSITGDMTTPAHGSREMPMWGRALSEARPRWGPPPGKEFARLRIRNLVDYLETLQVIPEEGAGAD